MAICTQLAEVSSLMIRAKSIVVIRQQDAADRALMAEPSGHLNFVWNFLQNKWYLLHLINKIK